MDRETVTEGGGYPMDRETGTEGGGYQMDRETVTSGRRIPNGQGDRD